ncbi:MAG: hypothetical protein CME67_00375 [Halobacteriovoraceae bacterium]|nr:hypothetical protein [Halobacteriovoraceae bacterium]
MDQIGKIKMTLSHGIKAVLPVAAATYFIPKDKVHDFRMTISKAVWGGRLHRRRKRRDEGGGLLITSY